ncbi:alpha/beta fold hydrolase [Ahrensia sp. R2A130]|uniref:alpha/beta fold hydrolase n=1 Tax=Ahrensia sp. R2A130 TaxID=744979 RepID=UPI0001E0A454|nr:alpha/beta hydrolase [Ahrensia sp. R2A130]EFL90668.1 putative hydrolase, alpha/beta fold family [Ahrensia sp. R2A130]
MSDQEAQDITRTSFSLAMRDGEILHGWRYTRSDGGTGSCNHLLALHGELGNARQLTLIAHAALAQTNGPASIITPDMRGRGRSSSAKAAGTDVQTDAADLISICDGLNLHHVDMLVSGRSAGILFNALPGRPTLCRKVVFNDGAPAFDPVGIAAHTARIQRGGEPATWEEAVERLTAGRSQFLEGRSADELKAYARAIWRDDNGKPVRDRSRDLVRDSNSGSFDDKQPEYWKELAILKDRPVLLIHGEQSKLVTNKEVTAMKESLGNNLTVVEASGQGHPPELAAGQLPKTVTDFLAA